MNIEARKKAQRKPAAGTRVKTAPAGAAAVAKKVPARAAGKAAASARKSGETGPSWTFLSNHTHVLVCLAADAEQTLRDVAAKVGITERAVQRIVSELEAAGALSRERDGRRNRYRLDRALPLRHPLEQHCRIGDVLDLVLETAP